MNEGERPCHFLDGAGSSGEHLELLPGEVHSLRGVTDREVGVHPLEPQPVECDDLPGERDGVIGLCTDTPHAGVDLEVNVCSHARTGSGVGQVGDALGIPHGEDHACCQGLNHFVTQGDGEFQDGHGDSCGTQGSRLCHGGDPQPLGGSCLLDAARNRYEAVAIGVRLHGHHHSAIPREFSSESHVAVEGVEVDDQFARAGHCTILAPRAPSDKRLAEPDSSRTAPVRQ